MASKSSKSSASSDPRRTIIVDDIPSTIASDRSRSRGGRLHSIGSIANRNTSSSKKSSSKSASSSKAKASATPRSSFKTRDSNEPFPEPLVFETFPQEFSFVSHCEVWNK